jgi:hypothetical protein
MKDSTLQNLIRENREKAIQKVLNGKEQSVSIKFSKPNDVLGYIQDIFNNKERLDWDIDQNGWQWDFWITFPFKDNNYMIAGDGFYQDSLTFSRIKE